MTPADLAALLSAVTRTVVSDHGLDASLVPDSVVVERPRLADHGDYSTNVALQLGKKLGVNPRELAGWLAADGVDLIDVSSAANLPSVRVPVGPSYQVALAAEVRSGAGVAVGAVGEITSGPQAEEILAAGAADVILAGREWLRDPHFALRAATELGDPAAAPWPPQYVRARPRAAH